MSEINPGFRHLVYTSLSACVIDRHVTSHYTKWWFRGWFIYLHTGAEEVILGTWDIVWGWQLGHVYEKHKSFWIGSWKPVRIS